jgi:energy-coupling factor transporter ATP-binding protein EcfA2
MSPGKVSSEKIRQLLNEPHAPGLEFIADHQHYEHEVLNGYTMTVYKYGFEFDSWCPPKLSELTCIIGHTNVGKTTVILWLLAKLIKQEKRVLIYSAENRVSNIHKQLVRFVTGRENISIEDIELVRPFVRYIKHEKHFSYRDMLNQATYLLDAEFDFDFFLIDPYNSLRIDNSNKLNTHEYHYQAAQEMRIFTTTTNKSIFLNCHTVTEAQRVKPDNDGHRPAPLDSDVEGGGKFPNTADNTIVLHRQISSMIPEEKYITELHVRKVRNQEFGGEPTPFEKPVKVKFRKNRTGFDALGSTEQKMVDYKQMQFNDDKVF